jgi:hypothetical protein
VQNIEYIVIGASKSRLFYKKKVDDFVEYCFNLPLNYCLNNKTLAVICQDGAD